MQGMTHEYRKDTLGSFLLDDLPVAELVRLDRTLLERAAECPFQARAIMDGRVNDSSNAANSGQAVHDAISATVTDYIESEGQYEPADLRNVLEQNLLGARPDIQPDAVAAARASIYEIAKLIYRTDPVNILAYDGGEDTGKSGQLALTIEPNYLITSELDFLYAGESPELLHLVDWKSGWSVHTAAQVAHSFQFNLHAELVFHKYEQVNGLEVRVLNTRTGQFTFRVTFRREKMGPFRIRLLSAIQAYETEVRGPNPATWPAVEKCELCPAATLCPVSGEDIKEVASDPKAVLRKLVAIEAKADAWKKLLAAHVDTNGDIHDGDVGFGRNKPKSDRKSPVAIYKPQREETTE